MKLKFNKNYFAVFIAILVTETLIAIYLKDGFIRHTFGDVLATILLYCFFKSFIKGMWFHIALAVLIISYFIEFLQLTSFLEVVNLQDSKTAKIILGSTFSIGDLIAYTFGIITILIFEHTRHGNS